MTDSEPGTPEALSAEAREELRATLRQHVRSPMPDGELRLALRAACQDAHARHATPERVIIALKDVWHSLPEVQQLQHRDARARDAMVAHVVTLCIQEFYGE